MKDLHTTTAVYYNHDDTLKAVKALNNKGFDTENLSIVGQGKVVENDIHVYSASTAMKASTTIGSVLGSVLGAFTGLGMIAVPGLGVLMMGGALFGAVGGLSIGAAGGGLIGALTAIGIGKDGIAEYEQHLAVGKYLLLCHGTEEEVHKMKEILEEDTEAENIKVHLNKTLVEVEA